MTVSVTQVQASYVSAGLTGSFSFPFPLQLASHLQVVLTNPAGVQQPPLILSPDGITRDYTVSPVPSNSGSVTLLNSQNQPWMSGTVLMASWTITITRIPPNTQLASTRGENRYNPEIHENEYDLLCMSDQYMTFLLGQLQGVVNVLGYVKLPLLTVAPQAPVGGVILYNLNGSIYLRGPTAAPLLLGTPL